MSESVYRPKAIRAILKAANGPYVRIDDGNLSKYLESRQRPKKIHCESSLVEDGPFCGTKGKNLHFAQPGGRLTCKKCRKYFRVKRRTDSGAEQ